MVAVDVMRFKVDLRRVAYWSLQGGEKSVKRSLEMARKKYDLSGLRPAGREMEWWWSELEQKNWRKAAERALTLSVLLK